MLFYYGIDLVDTVRGIGPPPKLIVALVQRLPDTSLTVALASGGRAYFGWGVDRHLAADTYDALNQNTRATGHWDKKGAPDIPAWPRPSQELKDERPEKKPATVAELYKHFAGKAANGHGR